MLEGRGAAGHLAPPLPTGARRVGAQA